ncbi:FG-GAP repeat domain-containing protein [Streptomyces sp. NBC_00503]|uniref:FG-GAP repeat domain-containing protein n=1 Tax=Streptomyces sp. NBC_00503 TaxID=2903659 RepID=UPI002E82179A|nr:VCBS repeat-containing protein [Streptomyces sp. NBC_00503]WUD86006.1 VCBS repeat-containing protein [Streptomyces sp. NBC_00503]
MRPKRSARLAASTAIALAAGMLLAGPASADGVPKPVTERPLPKVDMRGHGELPKAAPTAGTPSKQQLQRGADAPATATVGKTVPARFDVDHDGADDIVYRTIGGATYLAQSSSSVADEKFNVSKADYQDAFKDLLPAGDLNHNGYPELLTLSVNGTLSMTEAGSTIGTTGVTWSSRGWNAYNKLIAAGDLTGDGNADLLARTPNGTLYLYPGNGRAGSDTPYDGRVQVGSGWGMFDQILGGADYNADGIADVLATTPTGAMYFYAGTGNIGSPFADGVKTGSGWTMYNQLSPLVDKGGKTWVLARELSGTAYLYPSLGNGQLGDRVRFGSDWEYTDLLAGQGAIADHGKGEVFGRTAGGSLYAYLGKQNGNFVDREQIGDAGEYDLDFGLTLASSLSKADHGHLLLTYDGVLYGPNGTIGGGWGIYKSLLGVGDLDNDGYGDLLALDNSNVLWLYPSQGNAQNFADRIRVGGGWGSYNKLLGAGDFTGDGRADLLARGTDGKLWVYPGTGSGSAPLTDRVQIGSGGWNSFNKLAAVGDITGDGRGDLLAVDSSGTAYRYAATGLQGLSTFSDRAVVGGGWNTYGELF